MSLKVMALLSKKTCLRSMCIISLGLIVISAVVKRQHGPRNKPGQSAEVGLLAESQTVVSAQIPARILANALFAEGLASYQSRHIKKAIDLWELSLALWQDHTASRIKMTAAKKELADLIDEAYASGIADFQSLHFAHAIREWEMVLSLLSDSSSKKYQDTLANLELARQKIKDGSL